MKNEVKEYLTVDYSYIPYTSKNELNLKDKDNVYRNEYISSFSDEMIFSPISGVPYGLSEIISCNGKTKCLIIENDYKDTVVSKTPNVKDIYSLSRDKIKDILKIDCKELVLKLHKSSKNDLRDTIMLKEYVKEILDTLNLIDITYDDVKVQINIEKSDISSYQTLINYMGTYFNIEVTYKGTSKSLRKEISVYDVLDMHYKLKNSFKRDFIYITFETKNEVFVLKTKKYSNLYEILKYLEIKANKIIINATITINDSNFLLDDNVFLISII